MPPNIRIRQTSIDILKIMALYIIYNLYPTLYPTANRWHLRQFIKLNCYKLRIVIPIAKGSGDDGDYSSSKRTEV